MLANQFDMARAGILKTLDPLLVPFADISDALHYVEHGTPGKKVVLDVTGHHGAPA